MKRITLFLLLIQYGFLANSQTLTLIKDIVPGPKGIWDNGGRFLGSNEEVAYYFFRKDQEFQIWKTNGTEAGTKFIGAIPNVRALIKTKDINAGYIIFLRDNNGDNAFWILWNETGILERLIEKVAPVTDFVELGNELLFHPDTGVAKLIAVDLITKASRTVYTYGPFGARSLTACSQFAFIIADPNESNSKSTMAFYEYRDKKLALQQVVNSDEDFSKGVNPIPWQDKIFFWYHPANDPYQLWVTDGTSEGTHVILENMAYEKTLDLLYKYDHNFIGKNMILFTGLPRDTCNTCFDLYSLHPVTFQIHKLNITDRPNDTGDEYYEIGGKIFFSIRALLTETDGTSEGTKKFPVDSITGNTPRHMTAYKGRIYYQAYELAKDRKVVGTDLRSFDPFQPNSFAKHELKGLKLYSNMVVVGQRLLLIANDGIHGTEMWAYEEKR